MSRLDHRRVLRIRRGYLIIRVDLIAQIGLVCYDFHPECNVNQAYNCPGLMLISGPSNSSGRGEIGRRARFRF